MKLAGQALMGLVFLVAGAAILDLASPWAGICAATLWAIVESTRGLE